MYWNYSYGLIRQQVYHRFRSPPASLAFRKFSSHHSCYRNRLWVVSFARRSGISVANIDVVLECHFLFCEASLHGQWNSCVTRVWWSTVYPVIITLDSKEDQLYALPLHSIFDIRFIVSTSLYFLLVRKEGFWVLVVEPHTENLHKHCAGRILVSTNVTSPWSIWSYMQLKLIMCLTSFWL